ncbi:MAG: MASE1 domain-containing protein, partial [Chloroflexi bacterium]|nr:MASE1 domain-containing protein [Chloroflexota bacterium]
MPDLQQRKTLIPAIALLAVVYFLAGRAGLALALVHPSASAVWPPTGIALAALLLLGYRVWPGVLLGAFLVNFTVSGSPLTAAGIAAGNTLEALVGAYLTNRFANGPRAFERPQDVFKFTFLAAVASPMISATIGVASLAFTGAAPWSGAGPIWVTWHLGDVAGALIVAPLLLLGSQAHPGAVSRGQALEAAVLTLGAAAAGAVTFGALQPWLGGPPPLWFLSTPFLVWAAYRFGPPMTAAIIALLAAIAIWGTL